MGVNTFLPPDLGATLAQQITAEIDKEILEFLLRAGREADAAKLHAEWEKLSWIQRRLIEEPQVATSPATFPGKVVKAVEWFGDLYS